jgi:RHS repeat-associated protein
LFDISLVLAAQFDTRLLRLCRYALPKRCDSVACPQWSQKTPVDGFAAEMSSRKTQFPRSRSAISGHRYYNPSTGLWLSRDPIEENGGNNVYGICENNALNRW